MGTSDRSPSSVGNKFFDLIPLRAQFTLFLGIFFVFSTFGFLMDLAASGPARGGVRTAVWAAISGVVATGWAFAFIQRFSIAKFAAVWVPASFVAFSLARPPSRFDAASLPSAAACLVVIVVGYVFFVMFIRRQGLTTFRLLSEMSLARDIHSVLTEPIHLTAPRVEVFARSEASSEMGGDMIDAVRRDHRVDLFLGDVSGHGVSAGVVMGMVKSAVRMKLRSDAPLEALMRDLNHVIHELAKPGMFVTFVAMTFDESDEMAYAVAGHPPILHFRAARGEWVELSADSLPLGVVPDESYAAGRTKWEPGDLFVALTDGLVEVFDRDGSMLGWEGVRRILEAEAHRPLAEVYDAVCARVSAFGPRADDQSLLLVRMR